MHIRPLFDRVVVERSPEASQPVSSTGFLPTPMREKPVEGTITAVGHGRVRPSGELAPLQVKVGDRVVFGRTAGTEIKLDGQERLLLREDEILGILE